ncbi:hypothetical protein BDV41DRAFT_578973 [Aspergillus transmontanensis]|uniref:Uncharacterized protein n=1 Tax=Aspergillus transmontanensis TaxID=1034304 RepID=A0A5N6VR86_9EURO|nr:hypothetical protein BDV41DRAFT_578973 [Aspergillus transmontanensis]
MLGSASNPILINIEESSAKSLSPDDTDGDTIPETPSYRSQSHICNGQEDDQQTHHFNNGIVSMAPGSHKGHSVTIHGLVHEGVAEGSPHSGDIAAQPSNRDGCTPAVVSHATVAESSVRNVYTGHTTESGGPAALLGAHVSDGSKCMQNTMFPRVEQASKRARVDADTQTADDQRPNSMTINQSDDRTDSITVILTRRSAPEGRFTFLCRSVEWYSHHELRQWAPGLLDEYLHRTRLHERARAHKRRAVSETPLVLEKRKRFMEI